MQRRLLLPAASGVAGVALAHGVAYMLAPPGPSGSFVAHEAGHGYWHHAGDFGVLAAMVAVLLAAGRGLGPDRSGRAGFRSGLAQAIGWQISLFTCLEAAERVAAGGSVLGLPSEPVFWIGIAVQAVTAAVMLALLTGIEEIVAAVARARQARPPGARNAAILPGAVLTPPYASPARPVSRGPPCLAR